VFILHLRKWVILYFLAWLRVEHPLWVILPLWIINIIPLWVVNILYYSLWIMYGLLWRIIYRPLWIPLIILMRQVIKRTTQWAQNCVCIIALYITFIGFTLSLRWLLLLLIKSEVCNILEVNFVKSLYLLRKLIFLYIVYQMVVCWGWMNLVFLVLLLHWIRFYSTTEVLIWKWGLMYGVPHAFVIIRNFCRSIEGWLRYAFKIHIIFWLDIKI